ncbi:MAG: FAD-dependent oxidoreductase [Deltaproteobacteria bacterium]|nr:MAG: FAD-dependent oxidoreductase [Deltaproteobacteria bacterium]
MSIAAPPRIAVIGAGPAGLAAAIALTERGHTVRVFEKEATVGGKCHSLHYDGYAYDLGANLTTPRYREVRALARLLDLELQPMHERRVVSINAESIPSLADAGPLARTLIRGMARAYVALRAHTGVDKPGYAEIGPHVRKPFREWLQMHGLARFRDLFANLFIAYGYGVMDALPAAYALKFFDRIHFDAAIDTVLGKDVETTLTFTAGFQALWDAAVAHYGLDVKCEATVHAIVRGEDQVRVTWTDADGDSFEEDFDHLVLACPLQDTPQFLDVSDEEADLFGQIKTYDYYVTAAVLEGVPDASTFVYPYSTRWTPGQPTVFYPPVLGSPNDVFVFYSYGDESTTVDEVRANLRAVVEAPPFSGRVVDILHTQHWRYFPHVDSAAMQAGFFERLEGLQGHNRTVYVGEVLSFPLVELAVQYAQARVAEHL